MLKYDLDSDGMHYRLPTVSSESEAPKKVQIFVNPFPSAGSSSVLSCEPVRMTYKCLPLRISHQISSAVFFVNVPWRC